MMKMNVEVFPPAMFAGEGGERMKPFVVVHFDIKLVLFLFHFFGSETIQLLMLVRYLHEKEKQTENEWKVTKSWTEESFCVDIFVNLM